MVRVGALPTTSPCSVGRGFGWRLTVGPTRGGPPRADAIATRGWPGREPRSARRDAPVAGGKLLHVGAGGVRGGRQRRRVGELADLVGVGVAAEVETAGGVGAGGRGRARGVGRWRRGWCRLRPSECDELCRTVRPLRRVAGSRTLARMWRRSRRCAGEPNRAGRSEAGAWSDSRPMPMRTHRANAAIARAAATGDRDRAVGRMPESVGAAAIRPARARSRPGWRRHGR